MWINLDKTEITRICEALRMDDSCASTAPAEDIALADRLEADMKNREDPENDKWVSAAQDEYLSRGGTDGDIDIDGDAVVSDSDEGAYVMMWGWIRNEDVGIVDANEIDEDDADYDDNGNLKAGVDHS